MESNFHTVERFDGTVWMHNTKPMWIVFYPYTSNPRASYYQAYRPADYVTVPKGRMPWTVDNRRLSTDGFNTLEEAMNAIEERG